MRAPKITKLLKINSRKSQSPLSRNSAMKKAKTYEKSKKKFFKAATMTFNGTQHPIIDDTLSPQNNGSKTPPESKDKLFVTKNAPQILLDQVSGTKPINDGESSGMRVTKAPTEGSANWIKSFQSAASDRKVDPSIVDLKRLKGLGLGKLAEKIGENLQQKVQVEVTKYDKPIKLKVMTGRDIKKMKNQFSIFFEEPKTKVQAIKGHYR